MTDARPDDRSFPMATHDIEKQTTVSPGDLAQPACLDSSAWIEIAHKGHNAQTFLKAAGDMSNVIVSITCCWTMRVRRVFECLKKWRPATAISALLNFMGMKYFVFKGL